MAVAQWGTRLAGELGDVGLVGPPLRTYAGPARRLLLAAKGLTPSGVRYSDPPPVLLHEGGEEETLSILAPMKAGRTTSSLP